MFRWPRLLHQRYLARRHGVTPSSDAAVSPPPSSSPSSSPSIGSPPTTTAPHPHPTSTGSATGTGAVSSSVSSPIRRMMATYAAASLAQFRERLPLPPVVVTVTAPAATARNFYRFHALHSLSIPRARARLSTTWHARPVLIPSRLMASTAALMFARRSGKTAWTFGRTTTAAARSHAVLEKLLSRFRACL